MNHLSHQVVTWGVVSSVVTAAVALALSGDARQAQPNEPRFSQAAPAASATPAGSPRGPAPAAYEPVSYFGSGRSTGLPGARAPRVGGDS